VQRFRGGLVFKAQRRLYHSTLGLRVIKKKKKTTPASVWCATVRCRADMAHIRQSKTCSSPSRTCIESDKEEWSGLAFQTKVLKTFKLFLVRSEAEGWTRPGGGSVSQEWASPGRGRVPADWTPPGVASDRRGNNLTILRTSSWKSRPASGLDCLVCAELVRKQWRVCLTC